MKQITKLKLACVHQYCNVNNKSTEYMYQLMSDICEVDIDTINNYIKFEDHKELFKQIKIITEIIEILYQNE